MAVLTGRTRGHLYPPHASKLRTRGTFGSQSEHWHLKRDARGRFRSTARENPVSTRMKENPIGAAFWWIVGIVAGSGAAIASVAYAAKTPSRPSAPTTPAAMPVNTQPPVQAQALQAPSNWLVTGQGYGLVISCGSAFNATRAMSLGTSALAILGDGNVSNVAVTPNSATQTSWTVSFTYTGPPGPIPNFQAPPGCNANLQVIGGGAPQVPSTNTPPSSPNWPPTTVPANWPSTTAPANWLLTGQRYTLVISCASPFTASHAALLANASLGVLGSGNLSNISAPSSLSGSSWAIAFTYTGPTGPVPDFQAPPGCSAVLQGQFGTPPP
jgi:hypothetical protein